jgi:hypothetical protein
LVALAEELLLLGVLMLRLLVLLGKVMLAQQAELILVAVAVARLLRGR